MPSRPLILLTNDDGVDAPGLRVLKEAARSFGDVVVVAPASNRSAASHSITLTAPMRLKQLANDTWSVEGTTVDCVLMGLRKVLSRTPDWVLSGINRGPNLGDDTLYSGTVGGAMSGFLHGVKGLAVSLAGFSEPMHYPTAGFVVQQLLADEGIQKIAAHGVFNVNVPNLPQDKLKGIRVASLGRRHYDQGFYNDPSDPELFWYGAARPGHDGRSGTDSTEIEAGFATVSVLVPDYYSWEYSEKLRQCWPEGGKDTPQ